MYAICLPSGDHAGPSPPTSAPTCAEPVAADAHTPAEASAITSPLSFTPPERYERNVSRSLGVRRDLAREPRVLRDQRLVRVLRAPTALAMEIREDVRRHRLARHGVVVGRAERLLDQRLDVVERLVGRPAEQEPSAADLPVRARDACRFVRGLDARGDGRPAGCCIEE